MAAAYCYEWDTAEIFGFTFGIQMRYLVYMRYLWHFLMFVLKCFEIVEYFTLFILNPHHFQYYWPQSFFTVYPEPLSNCTVLTSRYTRYRIRLHAGFNMRKRTQDLVLCDNVIILLE